MPERDVMVRVAELRSGAGTAPKSAADRAPESRPSVAVGSVVQVNVSPGGVPKLPVPAARIHRLGLEGDGHDDVADHGGPLRAVSLLAIEAIRRVAAEGNPIGPGTTGENVTTEGIELALLPMGTQLAIGPEVVVELTSTVSPCKTIAHNFTDGRFARLSAKVHPLDTRLYASVVREGEIRPGDSIRIIGDAEG